MITFIANLTWQLANFNPKIILSHYGTSIDTFWLVTPVEKSIKAVLAAHKVPIIKSHNIGALIKLLPEDIQRLPQLKGAMGLTDYAFLSRYLGDLEPVAEFVVFRPGGPSSWGSEPLFSGLSCQRQFFSFPCASSD